MKVVKWVEALEYGLKFFLVSALTTAAGLFLIMSALSINFYVEKGRYIVTFDTVNVLTNVGSLTLLILGFAILVIGNVTALFKMLSEIIRNTRDYLW